MADTERNRALVLEYMDAFGTFDPEQYFPYLVDDPVYIAGANVRHGGRAAFKANTDAGRLLYPHPEDGDVVELLAVLADGDWVAVLLRRRAETNKVKDYENIYGMFFEVIDGKIKTQVELLDFRVSTRAVRPVRPRRHAGLHVPPDD